LVSNPPLSVFIPFVLRLKNYALLIWDIYPDILVSYGYISDNSIINKIWKNINKKVFSKAKVVFTLGEKMREVLLTYCADANVIVNPLWTNIIEIPQVDRKNNFFAQKYGIEDNFVIMYSGNLGKTHDVEFIVDLAISMQDCDSIKFVIIGDGYKKDIISQRIKDSSLTNCLLLPFQNLSDLPYSLSCADIGIVTLSSDASKYSIPSKIFNMMAAGEAFLAIADKDSELASIVNEFDLGKSFSVNQLDLMKEFIFELIRKTDMLIKYKANSQDASLHFTKINARKYHEVWFN
jgi:glycosyltransferase involved in cell wall biosynthesis